MYTLLSLNSLGDSRGMRPHPSDSESDMLCVGASKLGLKKYWAVNLQRNTRSAK